MRRAWKSPARFRGPGWCRWLIGGVFSCMKRHAEYASCGGRRPAALSGRRGGSRRNIVHVAAQRPGKADSMSFAALDHVATLEGVSPTERAVLAVLAKCERSGTCFPSLSYIAQIVGRSVRQVQRVLRALEARRADGRGALVERRPRYDRRSGRQRSNEYAVMPAERIAPIVAKRKPDTGAGSQSDPVTPMSPLEPVTVSKPLLTSPLQLARRLPVWLLNDFAKRSKPGAKLHRWVKRHYPEQARLAGLVIRPRRRKGNEIDSAARAVIPSVQMGSARKGAEYGAA